MAQSPYYVHYGTEEGLLNVEVYNMLQDSMGFIWIASDHGVSRFDGHNFRHFSIKDGLPHNLVTELFLDLQGRVWCHVYSKGLVCIEGDSVFTPQWAEQLAPYYRFLDRFGQLADGTYVVSFQSYMSDSSVLFAIVSGEENDITWIRHNDGNTVAILPDSRSPINAFRFIDEDQPYRLYWGAPRDGAGVPIVNTGRSVYDVTCSTSDSLVYLASDKYLISVSPRDQYCTDVGYRISNSLFIDKQQNLWAGLFKGGALCYEGGSLRSEPKHYLEGYSVTSVMQDRDGGYWFSTIEAGIFYMPFLDLQVYTTDNGLPENRIVKAWLADSTLWMIYRNGYATHSTLSHHEALTFDVVVHSDYIGPSFVDTEGILNVSISGDPQDARGVRVLPYSSALFTDSKGIMYTADPEGGLHKKFPDGQVWHSRDQYALPRINYLAEAADGAIWLGSTGGPYRMVGETCTFMPDIYPEMAGSVTCLHAHGNRVFIGIGGKGLFVLRDDMPAHLHTGKGLSSDFVHRVAVDENDTAWVATTSGIDIFSLDHLGREHLPIQYLGAGSGLPSVCVNDLLITAHHLWAFTDKGLAIIPRHIITSKGVTPPVYLTSVKVNGIPRHLASGLELLPNENNLQVEFHALAFRGQNNLLYAYRLNGTEETWNYSRVPSINLSGLKPGDYALEVKLAHASDAKPLLFRFSILPPLWQRWYVLLPAVMFFLLALYGFVYWRIRNLQWAARLEQQVSTLTFRALQAQMNPHFIFNSLNAIQNFILKNDQQASVAYLNKFSLLTRSVFDHSSRELVPICEELTSLELYVNLEQARYPGKISFVVQMDESLQLLKIPPMLLQPFVENAILHGILPSDNEGRITLSIDRKTDCLSVCIEDNGIGIRAHHQLRKKKNRFLNSPEARAGRAHTGIQVTCQRIESFMRKHGLKADICIKDRSSIPLNESGTLVSFTLPILRSP